MNAIEIYHLNFLELRKKMSKDGNEDILGQSSFQSPSQNPQNDALRNQQLNVNAPPHPNDEFDPDTATSIRPPRPLIFDTNNMDLKWEEWIQQFNWYAIATQLHRKSNSMQVATLMASMGTEAAAVFNTFNLNADLQESIEVIKQSFTEYFTPRTNLTYERYLFNSMHQEDGENFDNFTNRLKRQMKKCRDDLRKKLLAEDDLTLVKTTKICKITELIMQQLDSMSKKNSVEVICTKCELYAKKSNKEIDCRQCGTKHKRKQCPAFNKFCVRCGKRGHFSSYCPAPHGNLHFVSPDSPDEVDNIDFRSTSSE